MSDYISPQEIQMSRFVSFNLDDLKDSIDVDDDRTRFIHIGGPSAVGKTTLALILQSELPDSQMLSVDSYLIAGLGSMAGSFSDTPPDPAKPYIGGISPLVWEFSLLRSHIADLKARRAVKVPVFDQTIKDRVGYNYLEPSSQMILEGGHSFGEELRDTADYKVLVTAPLHDRLVRKAVRTHARYRRDDLDDVWGRYLTKDEPSWRYYEPEFTQIADQIFHNSSNPSQDFAKLPSARYGRAEGIYHALRPLAKTGILHSGEALGIIEMPSSKYQLCYMVNGRDLVNLPLDKQYVIQLENYYEITRGEKQ